MVYSTDPNYSSDALGEPQDAEEVLSKDEQELRVQLERKNRGGKAVTLITGFVGSDDDLKTLGKMLKTRCGVGGSAKDGEIIVQGDHREKVMDILKKEGYRAKRIN
ncbi:MAG: translation initiation factor [Flavobacteriales bacterium]|nr:translation initiation factor [Flavobacteriales bacterium]